MELSSTEFHKLYLETGENLRKVQLINGIVRMPSPVRLKGHERENCTMNGLMFAYCARVNGVEPLGSCTIRLNSLNEVQPDFGVRIMEGGLSKIEDGYVVGPVELVGEVSNSSVRRDMTSKFEAYRASGCKEYINWKVEERKIVLYKLVSGNYEEIAPVDGVLKSEQFPGLVIDIRAVLTNNCGQAMDRVFCAIDKCNNHNKFFSCRGRQRSGKSIVKHGRVCLSELPNDFEIRRT